MPVLKFGEGEAGLEQQPCSVQPELLQDVKGWHFYRFTLDLQLGAQARTIAYVVEDPSWKQLPTRWVLLCSPTLCNAWLP